MVTRTKSLDYTVREYVKKFSDEDLRYVGMRLSQRLGGDLGSVILVQEKHPDLNRLLTAAPTCDEVYNVVDLIDKYVQDTLKRFLLK